MPTTSVEITSQASETLQALSDKIGENGVIAGGAVRDLLLGREPKDYDIFTFSEDYYNNLFDRFDDSEEMPIKSETDEYGRSRQKQDGVKITNCTAHNKTVQVQIIHIPLVSSPMEVLKRFDFTINMVAYYQGRIILPLPAQTAINEKRLTFNCNHRMAFDMTPQGTVRHLIRRAYYLSGKLDLELPMYTVLAIYDKYPYDVDLEFEDRHF